MPCISNKHTKGSSTAPYAKPAKRSLIDRIQSPPAEESLTYTHPVKDDYTGKLHLWEIPAHLLKHIAEAGKLKPCPPKPAPLTKRVWTEEEKLRASISTMEFQLECKKLNKLIAAHDKLNKRIAAKKPKLTSLALHVPVLIARPPVLAIHSTLDPSLIFGKKKPLAAADHVIPMLEGTLTRLAPQPDVENYEEAL
ncbi:hypothetical protein WOLCODRAFT_149759 [Wolfiporia cocos MD-104 SS10]|uniref:Uncharacterized protein n=1 Tax=Wolfiporia cocos (strain MD-104) TaxID=742152 RepID=A0A2H3JPQ3_WOLCO|nr:hypothetical protein WOLCODRAFT_149759 [Wolfiporia cocos MD-104 SS10]